MAKPRRIRFSYPRPWSSSRGRAAKLGMRAAAGGADCVAVAKMVSMSLTGMVRSVTDEESGSFPPGHAPVTTVCCNINSKINSNTTINSAQIVFDRVQILASLGNKL